MYIDANGNIICDSFSSLKSGEENLSNPFRTIFEEINEKIKNIPHNMCVIKYPQKQHACQTDKEYKPDSGGKAMLNAPHHTEMVFRIQEKKLNA